MKRLLMTLSVVMLAAAPVHAQAVSDLVTLWLAQNGKTAALGDWSTCQPDGQPDGICIWNAAKFGAQPTTEQLNAMAPAWQAMRQAAQYPAIIAAGLAITSTGTPALSGTYGVDQSAQLNIDSQIASVLTNGVFTNGQVTRVWHDLSGLPHTFTVAQFKTLATTIGIYVDSVIATIDTLRTGSPASWPAATATIP